MQIAAAILPPIAVRRLTLVSIFYSCDEILSIGTMSMTASDRKSKYFGEGRIEREQSTIFFFTSLKIGIAI